jgi:antitoxin PrlF
MAETFAFEAESTLTDRYQTTIPDPVRKALHLNKRDKIHYTIQPNGQVINDSCKCFTSWKLDNQSG